MLLLKSVCLQDNTMSVSATVSTLCGFSGEYFIFQCISASRRWRQHNSLKSRAGFSPKQKQITIVTKEQINFVFFQQSGNLIGLSVTEELEIHVGRTWAGGPKLEWELVRICNTWSE